MEINSIRHSEYSTAYYKYAFIPGVGADDTFILVKTWTKEYAKTRAKLQKYPSSSLTNLAKGAMDKNEPSHETQNGEHIRIPQKPKLCRDNFLEEGDIIEMVKATLKHSTLTISVTSITTSVAFFASFISNVTAIKCFR